MEDIRPFPSIYSFKNVFFAFGRAVLGILLFSMGINFIFHAPHLEELISQSRFNFNEHIISYYISIAHLFGGAFIILGLITRIAIILQLPVLLAAVLFNIESPAFSSSFELFLSVVALALLIFYLIKGPGIFSMDAYRKRNKL